MTDVPIPETFEQAVEMFVALLEARNKPEDLKTWVEFGERFATSMIHTFTGMPLRNGWKLWEDTPLVRHMYERYGLCHADDLSGLITLCAHRELNGLPWFPESEVERYREHWSKHGGMPKPHWELP